ncbi:hypothetical protein M5G07_09720 [Serratia symbiotica]|nr:hypothetical protein [Serratia symbiotica]
MRPATTDSQSLAHTLALMVSQPSQTMPAGLATITCDYPPATPSKPRSWMGSLLLISLRMTLAGEALGLRLGLLWIIQAIWVAVITAELLRMTPLASTSNYWYWLCDIPA